MVGVSVRRQIADWAWAVPDLVCLDRMGGRSPLRQARCQSGSTPGRTVCKVAGMTTSYDHFAGLNVARAQALSDGVFAVAMTLLVLDLRVPVEIVHSERHLWQALHDLGPQFAAYLLS